MIIIEIIIMSFLTLGSICFAVGFIAHKVGNKKLSKFLDTTMLVLIGLFIAYMLFIGWRSVLS